MNSNKNSINYSDFVSFIEAENTPPLGFDALNFWMENSVISSNSLILDLACNTGFSSRNIVLSTNCKGFGIDISNVAIKQAVKKSQQLNIGEKISYIEGNAENLPFDNNLFTHVIAGCCLSFIADKDKALTEVNRVLSHRGKFCVSNFFYKSPPPQNLVHAIENYLGFKPSTDWDIKYWNSIIHNANFQIVQEDIYNIYPQPVSEIEYLVGITFQKSPMLMDLSVAEYNEFYDYFLSTRLLLNEHRKYQGILLSVYEKI